MNSVRATTLSSVYLAMRHIFPEVPISAGAFEPAPGHRHRGHLPRRRTTPARSPAARPKSASASPRRSSPRSSPPSPTGSPPPPPAPPATSPSAATTRSAGGDYVMYQISGGGYGGNADHDGLSNGCSTIGISKAPPVEIMEQQYPVLYRRYALHEGSGGAGTHRGGFGLDYEVELLRGTARASFVMDHGRFGPQGALGGADGGVNRVEVIRGGEILVPEHLSKAQDIPLGPRRPRPRPHPRRRRLRRPRAARPRRGRRGRPPRPLWRRRGRGPLRPVHARALSVRRPARRAPAPRTGCPCGSS